MAATPEQKSDVEDDKVMSEKETEPHSLSDYVVVPDKHEEHKEEFEAPEVSATPGKIPDVEDDKVMSSEKETQPHSLSDYIVVDKHDHEEHKEEFEGLEKPEGNNTEGEVANNAKVQPEGETLLVKTRLRYGQPSENDSDTTVRNEQWTPPDELLKDIFDRFKDVADADLEIYRVDETGVIRVKITKTSFLFAIIEVVSGVITWIIDNIRKLIEEERGLEAEVTEETDDFAVVGIKKRE